MCERIAGAALDLANLRRLVVEPTGRRRTSGARRLAELLRLSSPGTLLVRAGNGPAPLGADKER